MKLRRQPDFEQFLKVLWRTGTPDHLTFYEHLASPGFIARRTQSSFDKLPASHPRYWSLYVDFWLSMGYDCVPMEIPPDLPMPEGHGAISEGSEARVVIRDWKDYERYPWPSESRPIDFSHFETVGSMLPDGCKIVAGVCGGPYEWVSQMMGTIGLSYALADNPDLVAEVFSRIGRLHHSACRQLASMEEVGALRQGDDLGFKTSTFLSPQQLRVLVLPIYKSLAAEAHSAGKPFILHSCGNLSEVYDDLIDYCGIDAKHSFEDVIMPVTEFKRQYGRRVTPLGGLDVDVICRSTPEALRGYTRRIIDDCLSQDPYWALGTGNSLTNYMPVENYITVLEEGRAAAG